jgi:hypothetical protein
MFCPFEKKGEKIKTYKDVVSLALEAVLKGGLLIELKPIVHVDVTVADSAIPWSTHVTRPRCIHPWMA